MAKRAGQACLSVWERRAPRWFAALGVVLVLLVVVGVAGSSPALAGCIADVPEQTTPGTIDQARGVAGGTLTTSKGTWLSSICAVTGYHYQWFRDGTTLVGSDQATYSPVAADVEHTLSVQVEGCNTWGCSTWTTDSNSSTIYESALGLRRQYTPVVNAPIDDQESLQVNPADGNVVLEANDFSLPGVAGFGYQFTRSYNSLYSSLSPAGLSNPNPVFAGSWEDVPNLSFWANGDARYTTPSGAELTFTGSSYSAPPGSDATLIQQGDGTFLLTFHQSGMEQKFSSAGLLLDEIDRNGNTIAFSWSNGQLQSVTDTTGRTTTFHYTSGNVTSITAPGNCTGPANLAGTASSTGGSLASGTYYYEVTALTAVGEWTASSEINTAVTGPTGAVALTWNAVPGATSYRIYRGTSSGGENVYYSSSTASFTDTGGTGTSAAPPAQSGTCLYYYGYTGGQLTSFADPASEKATTYAYNLAGLLTTVTNPLGNQWSIVYDAQNRVSSITRGLAPLSGTASSSGGSLASGTYYYKVAAVAAGHVSPLSAEISASVTGPSGSVALSWSPLSGATSYRIYRGTTSGGENTYYTSSTGSFTDTGATGTSGSPPRSTTSFAYYPLGCSTGMDTVVTDANGNATSYCTDGRARVYETEDPLGNFTSSDYTDTLPGGSNCVDANGVTFDDRPCSTTDALSHVTQYGYDTTGQNLVWKQNPVQTAQSRDTWVYGDSSHPYSPTSYTDADHNVTNYTYTPAGNLFTVSDDNAQYLTSYTYNGNGERASETHGLNSAGTCAQGTTCPTTTYNSYDTLGDLTEKTDARNYVTAYTYDGAGNQTGETDGLSSSLQCPANASCPVSTETYDAYGRLLSNTNPRNDTTTYTYDAAGNQTGESDGLSLNGSTASFYCPSGVTCPTTGKAYDPNNLLLSETDPNAHTSYTWYDLAGNVLTETDADGNQTLYAYDASNRKTSETHGLNSSGSCRSGDTCPTTTYIYDADGNEVGQFDAMNYGIHSVYDGAGELVSRQEGLTYAGSPPSYSYSCGSGATCPTTAYGYDAAGNKLTVLYATGSETQSTYDGDHRLLTVTSGTRLSNGNYTCLSGDTCPETITSYDNNGNRASVTDPDGHETKSLYNADNEVSSVTRGLNSSGTCPTGTPTPVCPQTTYTYDNVGNQATVVQNTQSGTPTTTYTYYADGSVHTTTDPTGDVTTDTYDNVGNVISEQTPDGTTISCYDADGELLSTYYSGSATCGQGTPDVSYTYDAASNRLVVSTAGTYGQTTETTTYTNLEQPLSVATSEPTSPTNTLTGTFQYVYSARGDVTHRTYPDGTDVYYNYNNRDQLCRVATSSGSGCATTGQLVAYTYGSDDQLATSTHPSGSGNITETRSYDHAGRLSEVDTTTGSNHMADFNYTLDAAGNPTSTARTGWNPSTSTWGLNCTISNNYDNNERLTASTYSGCPTKNNDPDSFSWTYDADGNWTQNTAGATTTSYTLNAADQICATSGTGGNCSSPTFQYDGNGNNTTEPTSGGTNHYAYNLANDLTSVTTPSATTTNTYDGDANQLSTTTSGTGTYYFWDTNTAGDPQLALEENSSGTVTARYIYGLNRISFTNTSTGTTKYFVYDGLDSVANLVTSAGANSTTYIYNPYGSIRWPLANGGAPLAFAGLRSSSVTNLYAADARYYDTSTGRFLTQDPLGTPGQTAGTYTYANDNPVTYNDPNGNQASSPLAALSANSMASASGEISNHWEVEAEKVNSNTDRLRFKADVSTLVFWYSYQIGITVGTRAFHKVITGVPWTHHSITVCAPPFGWPCTTIPLPPTPGAHKWEKDWDIHPGGHNKVLTGTFSLEVADINANLYLFPPTPFGPFILP